jgi:hypothetical protein
MEMQMEKASRTMERAAHFMAILKGWGLETEDGSRGVIAVAATGPHNGGPADLSFGVVRSIVNCPSIISHESGIPKS